VLRVMRSAPISGRYSLIDLLVCMMYDRGLGFRVRV
jgi:hypothetical protein